MFDDHDQRTILKAGFDIVKSKYGCVNFHNTLICLCNSNNDEFEKFFIGFLLLKILINKKNVLDTEAYQILKSKIVTLMTEGINDVSNETDEEIKARPQ